MVRVRDRLERHPWLAGVVLLVCATWFSLLAANVYFWWRPVPDPLQRRARIREAAVRAAGATSDRRTRLEVMRDEARAGRRAVPPLYREEAQLAGAFLAPPTPLAGVAGTRTILCNETGPWLLVDADAHGFRNPPGAWDDPEVVLVGDSFVHGFCVPDGQDLAGQLRAAGQRVLSLGYGAAGPLMELGIVREYGSAVRPPVVVWVYFEGNDLDNLASEDQHPVLRRYPDPSYTQGLIHRQADVDSVLLGWFAAQSALEMRARSSVSPPPVSTQVRRLALLWHLRRSIRLTLPRRRGSACCRLDLLERVVEQGKLATESWGGRFVFVAIPAPERWFQHRRSWSPQIRATDSVLARVRGLGIPMVDVAAHMAESGDPRRFYPYEIGHLNADGYALVATLVRAELERSRPPPSPVVR